MNPVTISALAALGGSVIGGVTAFATTWLTQHQQARPRRWAQESARRERLYGEFVGMAANLYIHALSHGFEPARVVPLYALVSRRRLFAPAGTVQSANAVMHRIVAAYMASNYEFTLQGKAAEDELDLLRGFTGDCRADLGP